MNSNVHIAGLLELRHFDVRDNNLASISCSRSCPEKARVSKINKNIPYFKPRRNAVEIQGSQPASSFELNNISDVITLHLSASTALRKNSFDQIYKPLRSG